jgi:hypothetical protein
MMTDEQINRTGKRLAVAHFQGRAEALTNVLAEIERFRNKGDEFGLDPLDLVKNRVTYMIDEANRAAEAVAP